MRILVTGGNGLLAHSLRKLAPTGLEAVYLDLPDFELRDPHAMACCLENHQPGVVINTAACNLVVESASYGMRS